MYFFTFMYAEIFMIQSGPQKMCISLEAIQFSHKMLHKFMYKFPPKYQNFLAIFLRNELPKLHIFPTMESRIQLNNPKGKCSPSPCYEVKDPF